LYCAPFNTLHRLSNLCGVRFSTVSIAVSIINF
jgi:hypothetical protein